MGNRGGAFHAADKTLGARRWATKQWIACVLEFKGRHREVMQPNRYTELFFLDEATALAGRPPPVLRVPPGRRGSFSPSCGPATHGSAERARAPAMDDVFA